MDSKYIVEAFKSVTGKREAAPNELAASLNPEFISNYLEWKSVSAEFDSHRLGVHKAYSNNGTREFFKVKEGDNGKGSYYIPVYTDIEMGTAFVAAPKEEYDRYFSLNSSRVALKEKIDSLEKSIKSEYQVHFSPTQLMNMAINLEKQDALRSKASEEQVGMLAGISPKNMPPEVQHSAGRGIV